MRRLIARVTLFVTAATSLLTLGAPAQATFPGHNGRIAFVTARGGCCNISTMDPHGSDVLQLTNVASGTAAFDPFWSPDGRRIVFDIQRFSSTFQSQIWVMNADGSDQRRLLPDPFFVDYFPSYSPDGTQIVFNRCRPDFSACAIYRMNANGSGLTAITPFEVSVLDIAPVYSPDGSTIAFNGNGRGGVRLAVYLMNSDGSNVRRLTPPSFGGQAPDWSPDGSRIVFSAHCCGLRQPAAIWVINTDKTGLQQLTYPGRRHDFSPSFAPAGNKIAFERDSSDFSRFAVWIMNPNGTGATKVRGKEDGEPRWGTAELGSTPAIGAVGKGSPTTDGSRTHERIPPCLSLERIAVFPLLRFWGYCSH
jgi:Tol biopolymer transport system component